MFTLNDMWVFFVSLLIILPLISAIHQAGHSFFIWLFGGRSTFTIGGGKKLFCIGPMEIRRIFFWHSFCQVKDLNIDNKFSHLIVLLGGSLFNLAAVFIVNGLIFAGILEGHIVFYNFVYFSIYYVFFALFPARYSKKHPSDMMAIYDLFKRGKNADPID